MFPVKKLEKTFFGKSQETSPPPPPPIILKGIVSKMVPRGSPPPPLQNLWPVTFPFLGPPTARGDGQPGTVLYREIPEKFPLLKTPKTFSPFSSIYVVQKRIRLLLKSQRFKSGPFFLGEICSTTLFKDYGFFLKKAK